MQCKFERVDDKLVCSVCGYSIVRDISPEKLHKKCHSAKEDSSSNVKQQYPSLWQMTKNAATAAVEYVASGFKNVDDTEVARRAEICKGCEFYDKVQNRCYKCGCNLALKERMASGRCPLKKW